MSMLLPTACLSDEQIRRSRQVLPLEEAEEFARHLEDCPRCAASMDEMLAADPLVASMRGHHETPLPTGPMIELLKGLGKLPMRLGSSTLPGPHRTVTDPMAGDLEACPEIPPPELLALLGKPESPDELGRLGHYRVLKMLGAGGMGAVFLAEDSQLHRPVALKLMLPHLAASSAKVRFLREARAVAALKHDHVVGFYQVGEVRGVPFLAMELLEGESLDARLIRDERPDVRLALRVGREVALGLAAAHATGLTHRDIKPANIWLEGASRRVKILDFGLARPAGGSELTEQGCIVGTPAFMAPEQARDGGAGPSCDLFSLGCVLYRMSTGRLPFKGGDALATLIAVALQAPPPPCRVNPEVPQALSDLILRLLAKDAGQRPDSALAVAEALEAIAVPAVRRAAPRRFLAWAIAAALLLALGVATAGFFATYRIQTSQGEFTVEVADDDVAVAVDKEGGLKLKDSKTGKEYCIKARESKSLPAGEYELAVSEKDAKFAFSGRTFEVKAKEGPARVIVRFAPKSANTGEKVQMKNAPAKRDLAAERKVIDWVLLQGGAVTVSGRNGPLKSALDLPKKPWHLQTINLARKEKVTDESLKNLAGAGELESLILGHTAVTDAGMATLAAQNTVVDLDLSVTAVTDEGLKQLATMKGLQGLGLLSAKVTEVGLEHFAGSKTLQRLNLRNTRCTDVRLAKLAAIENLRELDLTYNPMINGKGLKHLAGLSRLEKLNLGDTVVRDEGLAHLAGLKNLVKLDLSKTKVTDEGVKHLAGMKKLAFLDLSQTEATGAGLSPFEELTHLGFSSASLSDQGLSEIARLKELRSLVLGKVGMTNERLKHLAGLKELRILHLSANNITDAGLVHLYGLRNLSTLYLKDTKVTDEGVKKLQEARPSLKIGR